MNDAQVPMPGFIREAQRRAAAAKTKTNTTEITQAPSTRTMATLVRAGWDFKERCGVRIWSHEEITGGFWVSEEIAEYRNELERKGS